MLSKSGKWRPIHWWLAVLNMNSLQQVLRKQRAAHCITLTCWSSNNATSLFIKKFVLFWEKKMSFTWAWIWAIGTDSIMRILTKKPNIVKKNHSWLLLFQNCCFYKCRQSNEAVVFGYEVLRHIKEKYIYYACALNKCYEMLRRNKIE